MRPIEVKSLVLTLALALSGCASAPDGGGSGIATLAVTDLAGKSVDPLTEGGRATVLVFLAVDCPISNRYAPELQRLQRSFAAEDVVFWFVFPDPTASAESVRQHTQEFGYETRQVLLDRRHELVKHSRATTTPEVAVFADAGRLIYHGRIDDRFPDFGTARGSPTSSDLEEVLTAMVRGARIPKNYAKAVGCYIPSLE